MTDKIMKLAEAVAKKANASVEDVYSWLLGGDEEALSIALVEEIAAQYQEWIGEA